jgi:low affinity Fe/Cu permease
VKFWRAILGGVERVASSVSAFTSQPLTFILSFLIVIGWTIVAFVVGVADSWVSGMHMAGPIVTLLLVLLLQHGQAKNTRALQLKLDELIESKEGASKSVVKAEKQTTRRIKDMEHRARTRSRRSRRKTPSATEPLTKKA